MPTNVQEQIAALEREKSRLEGHLSADENWLALLDIQRLNGSAPPEAGETERHLRRVLAANPYYSARVKIVEAITILRRLGSMPAAAIAAGAATTSKDLELTPLSVDHSAAPQTFAQRRSALGMPLGVPFFGEDEPPARETTATEQVPQAPAEIGAERTWQAPAPVGTEFSPARRPQPLPTELGQIRGVTPELAQQLAYLGIQRVGQVAGWTAEDVRRIAGALALGRAISKQNWIEQAALIVHRTGGVIETKPVRGTPPSLESMPAEQVRQELAPQPAADMHELATTAPTRNEIATVIVADCESVPEVAAEPSMAPAVTAWTVAQPLPLPAIVQEAGDQFNQPGAVAEVSPISEPGLDVDATPPKEATPVAATDSFAVGAAASGTVPAPPPAIAEPALSPRDWLAQRRGAAGVGRAAVPSQASFSEPFEPLCGPAPQAPPPLPAEAAPQTVPEPPPVAVAGFAGAQEAEVSITRGPALPVSGFSAALPAIRSLRTRLSGLSKPAEPEAGEHASYRGHVEEASVEIVRRVEGESAAGTESSVAHPPESRLVARFLKALKGKDEH